MSDKSLLTPNTTLQETEFIPEEEGRLRDGLSRLPTPTSPPDFNNTILERMAFGRDFDPWHEQILTRMRWMMIPAIIGFSLTFALTFVYPPKPKPHAPGSADDQVLVGYDFDHNKMSVKRIEIPTRESGPAAPPLPKFKIVAPANEHSTGKERTR